ncbi:MAG: hypothetical protein H6635_02675 [Anaerolineales bacterium]|nr:hypothetical protein [Anaerolineales bacterium]MCB9144245.1 hypothetical protein [Anaerolineales bacterium]
MTETIKIHDSVRIYLGAKFGEKEGWYNGIVVRIDPYSDHRSFYWVKLDDEAQKTLNIREISVFNPKYIQKTP